MFDVKKDNGRAIIKFQNISAKRKNLKIKLINSGLLLPVLKAVELPASITNLATGLSNVDRNNLTHL